MHIFRKNYRRYIQTNKVQYFMFKYFNLLVCHVLYRHDLNIDIRNIILKILYNYLFTKMHMHYSSI